MIMKLYIMARFISWQLVGKNQVWVQIHSASLQVNTVEKLSRHYMPVLWNKLWNKKSHLSPNSLLTNLPLVVFVVNYEM